MVFIFDRNAFVLAMTHFGTGLMTSVHEFYYVKLFLDVYQISQPWFQFAQVVYLIWNAVNDPLFAYWQDNSDNIAFRSRRHSILYGAPLFVLSFLLFWFPWRPYTSYDWLTGVHLTVALCCYDSLFTFVLLAHCALYTEISTDLNYHLKMTNYCKVASVIASFSLTVVQFVSNGLEDYRAFQKCCVCIAFFSCLFMSVTGKFVKTNAKYNAKYNCDEMTDTSEKNKLNGYKNGDVRGGSALSQPYRQFKEIMTTDFVAFVSTNFLQMLHMTFCTSFMVIFTDQLIPRSDISDVTRKLIYGSSAVLPTLVVVTLSFVVSKYGYYQVIRWSYITNIVLAVSMYIIGRSHTWVLVSFLLVDSCISAFVFSFFNLPLSDIIYQDQEKHKRKKPLSSSVFGYNALFTKPAKSVAPMVIVAILNSYGYESLKAGDLNDLQRGKLYDAMFGIVCLFPVALSLCGIYTWSMFRIRNSHTKSSMKQDQ